MLFSKQSPKADEYLQISGILGFSVVLKASAPSQYAE